MDLIDFIQPSNLCINVSFALELYLNCSLWFVSFFEFQLTTVLASQQAHLYTGDIWWKYESLIVSVHHTHHPYSSGGETPRVLVHILFLIGVWVLYHNLKHLREILT